MNEFLEAEYEQCLSLIKYYDERCHALVNYASGMSSALPSLLLAIYRLGGNATGYFCNIPFASMKEVNSTLAEYAEQLGAFIYVDAGS